MIKLVLFLVFASHPAGAQNRVGNGGDVVLCTEAKTEKIREARLLDFYETGHDLVAGKGEHEDILKERFEVLKKKDEGLAKQYQTRWESMKTEIAFKEGIALTEVDDSEHVFKPADKSCAVKQIALRKMTTAPGEPRFIVNKTYWDRLSPLDRAGLIMHEIVYEHFFKLGEKNSLKARSYNARLFSKKFETDSVDEYWKFVVGLKVPLYRK